MEHEHEGSTDAASASMLDRRATLAKLGLGAAAAWVAPSLVSVPAASAATVPPCAGCNEELVLNGGAETGLLVPWTSIAAGSGATISVVPWADLAGLYNAPPSAGDFAFFVESDVSSEGSAVLEQRIPVAGCVGSLFRLTGSFAATTSDALAVNSFPGVSTSFFDADDNPIVFAGISVSTTAAVAVPTNTVSISENFIVPAGAVTARVAMSFSMSVAEQQEGTGTAVFDLIGLEVICPA